MILLSLPLKILRALFGRPRSFSTGETFEEYARKNLLPHHFYSLLQKTHGYKTKHKNFVLSTDPDFKLKDRRTGKSFYVEAKYRSAFFKGQVKWCSEKQLQHYQRCQRELPVFVLLGIGGKPDRPAFVYLLPLKQVNFTTLYKSFAEKYTVHPWRHISSRDVWKR